MDTFWKLFKESVILQGLITIIVVSVYAYLIVEGRQIPDGFNQITGLVIGFFFGGKIALAKASEKEQ